MIQVILQITSNIDQNIENSQNIVLACVLKTCFFKQLFALKILSGLKFVKNYDVPCNVLLRIYIA